MTEPLLPLTDVMLKLEWSDGDLARRIGCSRQYVQFVRTGKQPPSPWFRREASLAIAKALGQEAAEVRQRIFQEEGVKADVT